MSARADQPHIGLVVEGRGDEQSIPLLLRRYLHSKSEYRDLLGSPFNADGKSNITRDDGIEALITAAANRPGCVGVIVFVDSDDDCPVELGKKLLDRCLQVISRTVVIVAIDREFEDWLYQSVETLELKSGGEYLASTRGLNYISENLGCKYVKTVHQARLTQKMDLMVAASRDKNLTRAFKKLDELVLLV